VPVSFEEAQTALSQQCEALEKLWQVPETELAPQATPLFDHKDLNGSLSIASISNPIVASSDIQPAMVIRQSGDGALLCEFGNAELDLALRFHVHFFRQEVISSFGTDLTECVPGIRSLQVQFNPAKINRHLWLETLLTIHRKVALESPTEFESRIITLPLSWDDPATQVAIDKYVMNVRPNAPWCCPNNIEFIRRANGLASVEDVKRIVYEASYLVMGLGDVYLGAPVAVPLDPRHRLVTTKYNPARTWTPENAVGIGGAYMCIYGMEGPGGYQFVGRTLPVWNRFRSTSAFTQPFLLRFFDQIKFVEVSANELLELRSAFLAGQYEISIESTKFNVKQYENFLDSIASESADFKRQQTEAFEAEKQRWREQGLFRFDSNADLKSNDDQTVPVGAFPIVASVSGSVWKCLATVDDGVGEDAALIILEAMKMEMTVSTPCAGKVGQIFVKPGETVQAGQALGYVWPS
jgi:urea carboxylase